MLALMSKTRWSSFSALPHLFFSVPTPFQSFIFHLHLLGNLISSTLPQVPSVMKVCEQKHRTESRCLGDSAGQDGNYRRWLCNRGWCVLQLLPELCLHSRIHAVTVEGMQPLTTGAPSWNTPYELAALASMRSEAHHPSGLWNCNEKKLTVLLARDPAVNICWSMFCYYICH